MNVDDISVVIPTLDAAATLGATLVALGKVGEIIVADGGSGDATRAVARQAGARVIEVARGRGTQIAAGIAASSLPWLLLLHADTGLAPGWRAAVRRHIAEAPDKAGYFRLAFDSDDRRARRVERLVAWRCRWLALPYGDQGLLIRRTLLDRVGGVRALPLMEDVDLISRLGRGRLAALDAVALTSARRYVRDGWTMRPLRNLWCLALWFLGVPPRLIVRLYG